MEKSKLCDGICDMVLNSPGTVTLVTSWEDGKIIYASNGIKSVLGFEAAAMVGECTWNYVHPDDVARVKSNLSAMKERGDKTTTSQYRRKVLSGQYIYVSGCAYLKDDVLYTQEHSVDQSVISQAMEEKQVLMDSVTHDYKMPVTIMKSAIETLQQSKLSDSQLAVTEQVQAALDFMQMTLDQYTEMEQLQAGQKLKPSLGYVDIKQLLSRCQTLIEGVIPTDTPRSGVKLVVEADPSLHSQIISDKNWLYQMCMDLLTNAYKFTHEGQIGLVVKPKGNFLRFEVHDSGIGVGPQDPQKIFEYSKERSGRIGRKNLHSLYLRTRNLGGSCGMIYEPSGNGAVFFFEVPNVVEGQRFENEYERLQSIASNLVLKGLDEDMPTPPASDLPSSSLKLRQSLMAAKLGASALTQPDHSELSSAAQQEMLEKEAEDRELEVEIATRILTQQAQEGAEGASTGPPKPTALVIDDTGSVRKLLCKTLESKDVQCEVARNGLEGLHMMRAKRYSLVLCDAFMPVMSGMECIQRFRQWEETNRPYHIHPRQFIVGISSYLEGFDRDSSAIDAFLSKPIDLKWLKELLRIATEETTTSPPTSNRPAILCEGEVAE